MAEALRVCLERCSGIALALLFVGFMGGWVWGVWLVRRQPRGR